MTTAGLPPRSFGVARRQSRLLFAWEARDGSLTARTGQVGAFSRASIGSAFDSNGRLRQLVHSQPRWTCSDADLDGARETRILLEDARTSAFTFGRDLTNAAWTKSEVTPALNARGSDGALASATTLLETVVNNSHFVSRAAAITANTKQAASVLLKPAGRTKARFYFTGGASTVGVTIDLGAGTIAPFVSGLGTLAASMIEPADDGYYRVSFSGLLDNVTTPANLVVLLLDAGGASSYAGDVTKGMIVDGLHLEIDKPVPSSTVLTGASTVARVAESLVFPLLALPQAMTVYLDVIALGSQEVSNVGWFDLGNYNGTTRPSLIAYSPSTSGTAADFYNGVASQMTGTVNGPTLGRRGEIRVTLSAAGVVQLGITVDGSAETVSTVSTPQALPAAWGAATLTLNRYGSAPIGFAAYRSVRIAAGVRALAYMRSVG